MKISKVNEPVELDILKKQKAILVLDTGKTLSFSFTKSYLENLKKILSNKHALQLLATDESAKKFAGYIAAAETIHTDHITIPELFITKDYQHQGLGVKLVKRVLNFAKQQDVKGVIVQTENENLPAQKLYKKMGFTVIDNPDWTEGITFRLKF